VCTTVPDGQQQQDGRTKKTTANWKETTSSKNETWREN
jgi:hypothetical protein